MRGRNSRSSRSMCCRPAELSEMDSDGNAIFHQDMHYNNGIRLSIKDEKASHQAQVANGSDSESANETDSYHPGPRATP